MLGVKAQESKKVSLKDGHLHSKDVGKTDFKTVKPIAPQCKDTLSEVGGRTSTMEHPVFPLSPRQERMYFMQQAHPDSRWVVLVNY